LEFNYGVLKIIILLCNWVKTNYRGSNATVKREEYGFTFVNFTSFIPTSNLSCTFPIHVEQVFFSKDPKERKWKVVLQKDPHGRHITKKV
jgi:hypothetical protein